MILSNWERIVFLNKCLDLNFLESNIGKYFYEFGVNKNFLNGIYDVLVKEKIDILDSKINNFFL